MFGMGGGGHGGNALLNEKDLTAVTPQHADAGGAKAAHGGADAVTAMKAQARSAPPPGRPAGSPAQNSFKAAPQLSSLAVPGAVAGAPAGPPPGASLTDAAKAEARIIFDSHDADQSGSLDQAELSQLLTDIGFTDSEVDNFLSGAFRSVDTDNSGHLDFDEFCTMYDLVKQKVIHNSMQMLVAASPAGANNAESIKAEHAKAVGELNARLDGQRSAMTKKLQERLAARATSR